MKILPIIGALFIFPYCLVIGYVPYNIKSMTDTSLVEDLIANFMKSNKFNDMETSLIDEFIDKVYKSEKFNQLAEKLAERVVLKFDQITSHKINGKQVNLKFNSTENEIKELKNKTHPANNSSIESNDSSESDNVGLKYERLKLQRVKTKPLSNQSNIRYTKKDKEEEESGRTNGWLDSLEDKHRGGIKKSVSIWEDDSLGEKRSNPSKNKSGKRTEETKDESKKSVSVENSKRFSKVVRLETSQEKTIEAVSDDSDEPKSNEKTKVKKNESQDDSNTSDKKKHVNSKLDNFIHDIIPAKSEQDGKDKNESDSSRSQSEEYKPLKSKTKKKKRKALIRREGKVLYTHQDDPEYEDYHDQLVASMKKGTNT